MYASWKDIKITQNNNLDNITIDAGNQIEVHCIVNLPENIDCNSIRTEVYYGKILENGIMEQIQTVPMNLIEQDDENRAYKYSAKIELKTGGNYGYTFRVMPQTAMMLDTADFSDLNTMGNKIELTGIMGTFPTGIWGRSGVRNFFTTSVPI